MLVILSGLPGVGKTTVARQVAARMKAAYVRVDTIEQTLRPLAVGSPIGAQGYLVAYAIASDNLALGLAVVADGVNASDLPRAAWREVAQAQGCRLLFVHMLCSDAREHRRRVEERRPDLPGHVLPGWEAISAMQVEPPPADALVLDTARLSASQAADEVVRRAGGTGWT